MTKWRLSTVDEILEYESDDEDNGGIENVRSDIVETILYRRVLNFAQAEMEQGRPMSNHLLRSMHQLLLSFGRGAAKSPGAFKIEQNYIGVEPPSIRLNPFLNSFASDSMTTQSEQILEDDPDRPSPPFAYFPNILLLTDW